MRRVILAAAFSALAAIAIAWALVPGTPGASLEAVARVIDGDSLVMATGERIRAMHIDAPETHPCRCARECRLGAAATDLMRHAVAAGVQLVRHGRDRYGRTLAEVYAADGTDVAALLLSGGLAVPYEGGRRLLVTWCPGTAANPPPARSYAIWYSVRPAAVLDAAQPKEPT